MEQLDQEQQEKINLVIRRLEDTGNYKVISKFRPVDQYNSHVRNESNNGLKTLMVLDVETTGLDVSNDLIIELGFVLVEFDPVSGLIFKVLQRYNELEDPGVPIPEQAKKVTGITDDDVKGKKLDDEVVNAAIAKADVIIAHNASFDRAMIERRFPESLGKWWGCSFVDGPWDEMGCGSSKLEFVAMMIGGVFYDAHRAITDVEVLLYILSLNGPENRTILSWVLERTRRPTYRVWATGAPISMKDVLKNNHRYRWNDGSDPDKPIKAWYRDGVSDLDAEIEMLRSEIYLSGKGNVTVDRMTGKERFTNRYQQREVIGLSPDKDGDMRGDDLADARGETVA